VAGHSPGRSLRALTIVHAALGAVIYRGELRDIAADGIVGAVPYRSERAAALWFIGSAFPGWLVGHLVDVAAAAGDRRSVRMAGMLGLGAGLGGAVMMPRSPMWIQVLVCAGIVRDSRRIAKPHTSRRSCPRR
jgi:Family of unknown function (DUF6463)